MGDRFKSLLARVGLTFKAPQASAPAGGGSLFSEQAFDRFLASMTGVSDPDEVLRRAGIDRARLRQLSGDDEITAAMDTRREALLAMPWRLEVEGAKDDSYPEPVQWLWRELEKHVEKVLRGCMEALPYGYSVQEAVYANADGGRITWAEITEKPFEWFVPRLDGSVLYKSQARPPGEATDPRKFFLTVRNQTYRQPYGEALYSRLYWPWFFRQQGWRFWVRWLERFGTPLLVGKTEGDAKAMAEQLAQIANNAAIAVGAGDDVQVAENKSGAGHFEGFERVVCGRIQKLILGQTLTTDAGGSSGNSGSYALGKVHNEVREDRRNADVRMVRATMQRIVNVLWDLNGFSGEAPEFVLADDTGLEPERADRDAKLVQAGVVKLTPDYLLRVYDYEPEDIDTAAMQAAAGQAAQPSALPATKASAVFGAPFTPAQTVIERQVERAIAKAGMPISDADLRDAILAASDPRDLAERLAVLLSDKSMTEFEDALARALFAADIIGYAHATKG